MSDADFIVHLTDMAHGGDAVGRHDGKVVFVPYGIPGERVRARLEVAKKTFSRAMVEEVLSGSPQRVEPSCPYFGTCGGCQWQHIDYPAQLAYKQSILTDQLKRIGKLDDPPVFPMLGMPDPWRYRNHARFAVSRNGQMGFRARNSHEVVAIDSCPILHPLLDETFQILDIDFPDLTHVSLRVGARTGDVLVALASGINVVPAVTIDAPVSCVFITQDGAKIVMAGRPHFYEEVAERSMRVSLDSFFQTNIDQTERVIRMLEEHLHLSHDDCLLDAYCGVGTLGLPLAERVSEVIGVESCSVALEDARVNANGLSNVRFMGGRAETVLPAVLDSVSVAILDPPRGGCHRDVIRALCDQGPNRIAYVSCDPASLARDIGLLVRHGRYQLRMVQPIDMFPQTYHVESVSFLVRA